MSLYISISTSKDEITDLKITRRGNDYSNEPDSWHRYSVHEIDTHGSGRDRHVGHVWHRYGDGADWLAISALRLYVMPFLDVGPPDHNKKDEIVTEKPSPDKKHEKEPESG